MKKYLFPILILGLFLLLPDAVWAQATGGGGGAGTGGSGGTAGADIWSYLAAMAGKVGGGLTGSGYIIAGLGLITFSFMAIFNKIKWSTLAYIMLSTFVLSAMTWLVSSAQDGGSFAWIGGFNGGGASPDIEFNADSVTVSKGG